MKCFWLQPSTKEQYGHTCVIEHYFEILFGNIFSRKEISKNSAVCSGMRLFEETVRKYIILESKPLSSHGFNFNFGRIVDDEKLTFDIDVDNTTIY